jgi:L-malate glycosyltransferase
MWQGKSGISGPVRLVFHNAGNNMPVHTVAHVIYSHAIGGSETCAMEICGHLTRSQWNPLMLFMHSKEGPLPAVLARRGIPFADLNRSTLSHVLWPWLPALMLRNHHIDVLHVHHLAFLRAILPAARLAGIRNIVCTEHSHFEFETNPSLWKMVHNLPKKIPAFTVISQELRNFFSSRCRMPESEIKLIYNGVDEHRFAPGARTVSIKDITGNAPFEKVIVAVGRLADAKDYPNLLASLHLLKKEGINACCIIVGDGELRASLEKEIIALNLSDRAFIAGTRTDVENIMKGADCYVLSSKHEGLPISLLEAMSSGLPVVATQVGGVSEVVSNEINGLVVPRDNPRELAAAIARILSDAPLAGTLGRAARSTVEQRFSWDTVTRKYEMVYAEVCGLPAFLRAPGHAKPIKGTPYEISYSNETL